MNIIICGAGRVGFSISKQLSAQGHSITVIDQSSEFIQNINKSQDVKGIVGTATFPSVLEKANAAEADMIIAVTKNDETNMIVCQVAHSIFNISKKIARIRSQEFLGSKWSKLYSKSNLPIDVIISPELEVAKSLQRKLEAPGALDNVPFAENKITVLEIAIEKKCPVINTPLEKLTTSYPNLNANVLGVIRNNQFVILKKKDELKVDDKAYVVISTSQIDKTLSIFGHEEKISKNILIIGGGNIGFNLAKNLETDLEGARVKIIEKSKERAEHIANELNNTIVINGNGLDEEVLKEANIEEIETVLCLTNDDEDNIMASVLAEKNNSNKRTIAIVNKQNYSLLQSSLKIDDLVDPRMTTVSTILKHVHKGTIETVYSLLDGEYEFIEAEVNENSELIDKNFKESNLPEHIRIGAILRKDKVIIPDSKFKFEKKDLVIFLTKRDYLDKVENLFKVSSL
ncbi:MAG: Trk system potassium transport protein TrkA [Candidatus Pelagibacter sp. TMED64]|nr:Trk system potassium transporter TrkA [Candidatus Pelagibacter sp.]OUU67451.1 MAG: Trk system potassium transport protein TrkA [Candidatus Pelagibacter sp. TMED64]|tara:strand:- start:4627 stop:6000 length:1374 start_codon:yes stop_codon:yes gene_type:complete